MSPQTQVCIPATIQEAIASLTGIHALLKAKEWERAAIIAAFVEPDTGNGRPRKYGEENGTEFRTLSRKAFAALKIAGLSRIETVNRYVRAWESTGRPRPEPGDVVDLDGLPEWPVEETTEDAVKKNVSAVVRALADPQWTRKVLDRVDAKIADVVAEAIVENQQTSLAVYRAQNRKHGWVVEPHVIDDERREEMLRKYGAGFVEVLEASILADRLSQLAGKFLTPDNGNRYSDNAVTVVKAAVAKGSASLQHIDAVVSGEFDTRVSDTIAGLVP